MLDFSTFISELGFCENDKTTILEFDEKFDDREVLDFVSSGIDSKNYDLLTSKCVSDSVYAMAALTVFLKKAFSSWEQFEANDISREIYIDTMSDIRVWAYNHKRANGVLGVSEIAWLHGFVNFHRFKLGRLQYNTINYEKSSTHADIEGLEDGDRMLEIHIQQDGPFTEELCTASLNMAKEFFGRVFPDYKFKGFLCHSWMVSPGLAQVLPETSNILRFGKRFQIVEYEKENDSQAIERIFETRFKDKPEILTSLQVKAKSLLDEGGHLGVALGVIL